MVRDDGHLGGSPCPFAPRSQLGPIQLLAELPALTPCPSHDKAALFGRRGEVTVVAERFEIVLVVMAPDPVPLTIARLNVVHL